MFDDVEEAVLEKDIFLWIIQRFISFVMNSFFFYMKSTSSSSNFFSLIWCNFSGKNLEEKRDLKKPTKNARKNANLFEYLLLQQKNCNVRSNELKTAAEAALHFPDEKIIL